MKEPKRANRRILWLYKVEKTFYYINTNEIPAGEHSRENLISSHVKILPLLWLDNKLRLLYQKTIKVKWFGISLVFISKRTLHGRLEMQNLSSRVEISYLRAAV